MRFKSTAAKVLWDSTRNMWAVDDQRAFDQLLDFADRVEARIAADEPFEVVVDQESEKVTPDVQQGTKFEEALGHASLLLFVVWEHGESFRQWVDPGNDLEHICK